MKVIVVVATVSILIVATLWGLVRWVPEPVLLTLFFGFMSALFIGVFCMIFATVESTIPPERRATFSFFDLWLGLTTATWVIGGGLQYFWGLIW